MARFRDAQFKNYEQAMLTFQRPDGTLRVVDATGFFVRDADGQPTGVVGIFRDLTEQQRQEQEYLALQQQIIEIQQATLRELSTPLIPISKHVVLMPLIGSIDSGRAQQVIETLLEGVAMQQADIAIIDITGVPTVDTQVANALLRAAKAVHLLGAQVMLTGIKPQIAQTLVHLGIDLTDILTHASLQAGIAMALKQQSFVSPDPLEK